MSASNNDRSFATRCLAVVTVLAVIAMGLAWYALVDDNQPDNVQLQTVSNQLQSTNNRLNRLSDQVADVTALMKPLPTADIKALIEPDEAEPVKDQPGPNKDELQSVTDELILYSMLIELLGDDPWQTEPSWYDYDQGWSDGYSYGYDDGWDDGYWAYDGPDYCNDWSTMPDDSYYQDDYCFSDDDYDDDYSDPLEPDNTEWWMGYPKTCMDTMSMMIEMQVFSYLYSSPGSGFDVPAMVDLKETDVDSLSYLSIYFGCDGLLLSLTTVYEYELSDGPLNVSDCDSYLADMSDPEYQPSFLIHQRVDLAGLRALVDNNTPHVIMGCGETMIAYTLAE